MLVENSNYDEIDIDGYLAQSWHTEQVLKNWHSCLLYEDISQKDNSKLKKDFFQYTWKN